MKAEEKEKELILQKKEEASDKKNKSPALKRGFLLQLRLPFTYNTVVLLRSSNTQLCHTPVTNCLY